MAKSIQAQKSSDTLRIVLRNALPQIPGATFYDRLIVGLVVIVIVVMDQVLQRRKRTRQ